MTCFSIIISWLTLLFCKSPFHLCSEHNYEEGVHKEVVSNESRRQSSAGAEQDVKPVQINVSIATALSNAGHTIKGAQGELVLNPLRLAFETKNIKVVEPALDCLHVRALSLGSIAAKFL